MALLSGTCQDVISFWQFEGNPSHRQQTILPQGVSEIIFSFSDTVKYRYFSKELSGTTPRCFVNGMTTAPIGLTLPVHQVFFGVVLYPHALRKLLSVPPGEFLDSLTDITLVEKDFSEAWHRLAEAETFEKRVNSFRCWIENRTAGTYRQEMVLSSFLSNGVPATTVTDLSQRLCYSVRQLHRKSHEFFGMPTEALIHYKRYLCSLRLLHQEDQSLTDVAYQSGFYDQSHFIRGFREFTGMTPGEYRKQKSQMTAHLFS